MSVYCDPSCNRVHPPFTVSTHDPLIADNQVCLAVSGQIAFDDGRGIDGSFFAVTRNGNFLFDDVCCSFRFRHGD